VINSQIPSNDSIESLINVDIQSVDFSDVEKVQKLLLKGQAEVKANARVIVGQRRLIQNLRMKRYRQQKRIKNLGSLICHMKEREMLSAKTSRILKVSRNNIK